MVGLTLIKHYLINQLTNKIWCDIIHNVTNNLAYCFEQALSIT